MSKAPACGQPTCRICLDPGEATRDNPLISPCQCRGSTAFVHRQCLRTWRDSKQGSPAHYRCEICHFSYQYRRLWHARVLRHPLTSYTIFSILLLAAASILGFIPLLEALHVPRNDPATHFTNGLMLVGIVGFVLMLVSLCSRRDEHLWRERERRLQERRCCCPDCGCCAINCNGVSCGEDECACAVLAALAVAAAMGIAFILTCCYGTFFRFVRSKVSDVEVMVENVGTRERARAARDAGGSKGAGGSAGGGEGAGPGGAGGGGLTKTKWGKEESGVGSVCGDVEQAPLVPAPKEMSCKA
ncbi:hypothetical protein HYH03_012904 [Edaphochlamys debaryana]|uniref:RING-CH-type domain-containing protein n=1 Tax=Edaphochlamys debaryana TaxID=47281 RepID=A0A835XXC3_9CHLO|nr:hypothetical protein HYH03_012904 [Edaphochlamys debaryana]|eukprot:KAG2488585.1 hypothetical protein HYH03_012904 [Edaphochlamys debaryana]